MIVTGPSQQQPVVQAPVSDAQDPKKTAEEEVEYYGKRVKVTGTIYALVGGLGLLWAIYCNQTARKGAAMIVKCASNPEACHKRGHWGGHWDHHEEDLDKPISREEFEIYDILKSFSLLYFFFSLLILIMGKCAKRAVRAKKQFIVKRVFRKSLIAMIPIIILIIGCGKHCKHMHKVIEHLKHKNQTQEIPHGRNLQEQDPFKMMDNMMHEIDREMNQEFRQILNQTQSAVPQMTIEEPLAPEMKIEEPIEEKIEEQTVPPTEK